MTALALRIACAAAMVLGAAGPAWAQEVESPATGASEAVAEPMEVTTAVRFEEPTLPDLPFRLAADVTDLDGAPVAGVTVSFSLEVSLAGGRFAGLSRAVTDASGTARANFVPRTQTVRIKARVIGSDVVQGTESVAELTFPPEAVDDAVPLHGEHPLLADIHSIMPLAIIVLVALLWVALISLGAHTVSVTRAKET